MHDIYISICIGCTWNAITQQCNVESSNVVLCNYVVEETLTMWCTKKMSIKVLNLIKTSQFPDILLNYFNEQKVIEQSLIIINSRFINTDEGKIIMEIFRQRMNDAGCDVNRKLKKTADLKKMTPARKYQLFLLFHGLCVGCIDPLKNFNCDHNRQRRCWEEGEEYDNIGTDIETCDLNPLCCKYNGCHIYKSWFERKHPTVLIENTYRDPFLRLLPTPESREAHYESLCTIDPLIRLTWYYLHYNSIRFGEMQKLSHRNSNKRKNNQDITSEDCNTRTIDDVLIFLKDLSVTNLGKNPNIKHKDYTTDELYQAYETYWYKKYNNNSYRITNSISLCRLIQGQNIHDIITEGKRRPRPNYKTTKIVNFKAMIEYVESLEPLKLEYP